MEKEIIEGDKLIAIFANEHPALVTYWPEQLEYHSNWSWIMPVVEKIEAMGYGFHKDPFDLNIIEYLTGEEKKIIAYQNEVNDTLIQKWYYSVVEFIKWYNTQPKKQIKAFIKTIE